MTRPDDPFAAPTPGAPASAVPLYGEPLPARSNGLAVAALVVGVLSVPAAATVVGGLLLGAVAVVLGLVARRRARRGADGGGLALAGALTGAAGVALSVAVVAVFLSSRTGRDLRQCLSDADGNAAAQQVCQDRAARQLTGR